MRIENNVLCPECGPDVRIDEDGCCAHCGAVATGRAVATLARRLRALERVVEAARDALTIHEDVACSCRGCQRIRAALAAAKGEGEMKTTVDMLFSPEDMRRKAEADMREKLHPIDPALLTLTAAALPECIRDYYAYAEREGFRPDWQTGVGLDAIKIARATLAALRILDAAE